jgi:hypothetical protein
MFCERESLAPFAASSFFPASLWHATLLIEFGANQTVGVVHANGACLYGGLAFLLRLHVDRLLHTRVPRVLGIHVTNCFFRRSGPSNLFSRLRITFLSMCPRSKFIAHRMLDNEMAPSLRSIVAMMAATKILHIAREERRLR